MGHLETTQPVHAYIQKSRQVLAVKWPSEWRDQAIVAQYLGEQGVVFQFEGGYEEPHAKQYIPQLYLFTRRYDRICVRIGDWVVLKGEGKFVVVDKEDFASEYASEQ